MPAMAVAGPTRCDAVFIGPADDCALSGEWSTTVTARSEAKARKAVLARLGAVVRLGAEVQAERVAGSMAELAADSDRRSCPAIVLERAHVSCMSEPSLSESRICIADLEDEACYTGLPVDHVGLAWKVAEVGRAELCSRVDQRLADAGASAMVRKECRVSCERNATVRCVPR